MYPYKRTGLWGVGLLILVLLSCGLVIRAEFLEKESKAPVRPKEASIAVKPFIPKTESMQEPSIELVKKVDIPKESTMEESMAQEIVAEKLASKVSIAQEPAPEKLVSPSLEKPIKESASGSPKDMAVFQNLAIENEAKKKEAAVSMEEIPGSMSVLVVDDSEVNRDLLLRMLTLKDYKAKAVSSGEAALKALCEESFDLLLIDCIMPEMDGYALAEKIRTEGISSMPVLIAMSPRHDREEAEKCAKAGFDNLLVKPFTMTALDQQIRLALGNKSAK